MTFLDEPYFDYAKPQPRELRDLFVLAYWDKVEARELALKAGMPVGNFPLLPNMRLVWTQLLRDMAQAAKLRKLVETAAADPNTAGYQTRFAEMLGTDPPVRVPEQDKPVKWQGVDQNPAVARKLREERLIAKRNRLLHIDVAQLVTDTAPSVARLQMQFTSERAYGTAFLIQPDVLLTNYHNLVAPQYGNLLDVVADFDDQRNFVGDHLIVPAKIDTVVGDQAHDWAVIQLDKAVKRPPLKLGSPYKVYVKDGLIIIQHPLGLQKQFALDGMAVMYADENLIQYVADTQKGSSGSPVFSTNMHIVALHHAEVEMMVDAGGGQEVVYRNEGIHINQVMQGLDANNIKYEKN